MLEFIIYITVGIFLTYTGHLGYKIKEAGRSKRLLVISFLFYPFLYLILLVDYFIFPELRGNNKSYFSDSKEIDCHTNIKNSYSVSVDKAEEIKKLYKKACKLCHPDKLPQDLVCEAENVFKNLNDAYTHQDIYQVRKILIKLENGGYFQAVINGKD